MIFEPPEFCKVECRKRSGVKLRTEACGNAITSPVFRALQCCALCINGVVREHVYPSRRGQKQILAARSKLAQQLEKETAKK